MLIFEGGKAVEVMHVVMGEASRVESCTLGWICEGLGCSVAGQRGSLSTPANAGEADRWETCGASYRD
jgi:hypothetical protein